MAKRKTLFDDRPVEISELTYVIKQDLASLNNHIASLQALTLSQHPKASRSKMDQEGEHNDNVRTSLGMNVDDTDSLGCCYAARETGGCRRKLQGSTRGSDKKYPGVSIEDRELRIVRIFEIPDSSRSTTLRFPAL